MAQSDWQEVHFGKRGVWEFHAVCLTLMFPFMFGKRGVWEFHALCLTLMFPCTWPRAMGGKFTLENVASESFMHCVSRSCSPLYLENLASESFMHCVSCSCSPSHDPERLVGGSHWKTWRLRVSCTVSHAHVPLHIWKTWRMRVSCAVSHPHVPLHMALSDWWEVQNPSTNPPLDVSIDIKTCTCWIVWLFFPYKRILFDIII